MKDVATIIWRLAKEDKSFDGLTLKEMFRKKCELDADELREKLRDIVANHIKTQRQPNYAELVLSNDDKNPNYIFGGRGDVKICTCSSRFPDYKAGPFSYHLALQDWVEVVSESTKYLIESAIIPLDLKWRIHAPAGFCSVIVSWKHWQH